MSIMLDIQPVSYLVTDSCWDVAIRTILNYHNISLWDKADYYSPWAIYAEICSPKKWEKFKDLAFLSEDEFTKQRPEHISSPIWEHVYKLFPDIPGQEKKVHGYMRGLLYDYLKTYGFRRCPPPHWRTGMDAAYIESLLRNYGPIYCSSSGSLYYDGFEAHSNVIFAVHDTDVYFREGSTDYLNILHGDIYINAVERSTSLERFNKVVDHDYLYYYNGQNGHPRKHKLKEKKNEIFIQLAHEARIRVKECGSKKFPISGRRFFRYTTSEEIQYMQKVFLKTLGKHYTKEDVEKWIQDRFFK